MSYRCERLPRREQVDLRAVLGPLPLPQHGRVGLEQREAEEVEHGGRQVALGSEVGSEHGQHAVGDKIAH